MELVGVGERLGGGKTGLYNVTKTSKATGMCLT